MSSTDRLTTVGRTVRVQGLGATPRVRFALIVGGDALSDRWLRLMSQMRHPALSHYLTLRDATSVVRRMHIRPHTVPAFLVLCDGWMVDWFPAPALPRETTSEPSALDLLHPYLVAYGVS